MKIREIELTFDLPVEYRGLLIHPINLKDYAMFYTLAQCLVIDKNSIPDIKVISMSYLEYLIKTNMDNPDDIPYVYMVDRILALVLPNDSSFSDPLESMKRYALDEKGKPYFFIGDVKYTAPDFEEIRLIICEQNLIELPDENISKEVRDSLAAAQEYKNKLSGAKSASLEEQIIALATVTGWSFAEMYNMTCRKFIKSIRIMDNTMHYKIYLAASMSGMVEFKDKSFIKHWLTDTTAKDPYENVTMDMKEVENKIGGANGG
jgi:hypothetical protein